MGIRLLAATPGERVNGCLWTRSGARWFGVLYLITFVTSIPALLLYEPALRDPVAYIAGGGNDKRILFGAFLELLLIIANIGTAVVIVPIMRRQFEELSIGYVTARIVECTFILVGIVAMLGIVTLHKEAAGANEGTIAYTLAAIKDWTFLLGPGWVVAGERIDSGLMMSAHSSCRGRGRGSASSGGFVSACLGKSIVLLGGNPRPTRSRAPQAIPRPAVGAVPGHLLAASGVSGARLRSSPTATP